MTCFLFVMLVAFYVYELFLLTTLLTPSIWVFHTKQFFNSLWTPTGYQTLNYLELAQTPQFKGSDCPPTS